MANHLRAQIRARVKSTLTGLGTTGTNVFTSRVSPYQNNELPALNISMRDEEVEIGSMGSNRLIDREVDLEVVGSIKLADGFEDVLDQIAKEVEVAIAGDQDLGGLVKFAQLANIRIENDDELEIPAAAVRMTFRVSYYTAFDAPDVAY